MPDFNVRSDSVNVEQIMEQIRARIREKRGVDYTEQQLEELAAVKLEKFLDPRGVRSDLLDRFKQAQASQSPPEMFTFEAGTLYETHRAPLRWIRRLLSPMLKLFFNPNAITHALHLQAKINEAAVARRAFDHLYYEVLHNLVVEATRTSIDVKNLRMRVESLTSRLEFNERRARALESVVTYRSADEQEAGTARPNRGDATPVRETPTGQPPPPPPSPGAAPEGPGQRSRRRRRRRGRRGTGSAVALVGQTEAASPAAPTGALTPAPPVGAPGAPDGGPAPSLPMPEGSPTSPDAAGPDDE